MQLIDFYMSPGNLYLFFAEMVEVLGVYLCESFGFIPVIVPISMNTTYNIICDC
ncbi:MULTISPECIES: hypothetical protein [unclassified Bacillus (in: firmicutes)]|uniref:hypothetical protein n=1 Tax=unclassified Bacillus (in: firmicutes) TaxID=185979 RepID=UPI001596E4AC|nr:MULTISPECIES: hypothetical protein [unclassified Bacillus (in: firmicutes)]